MRNGVNYYEVDYLTLYNFVKENGLKYSELSEMLGKEGAYISGVLTKNRKVPEDILDKLCDLMGKSRGEVLAHENSAFNTTLVVDKEDKQEDKDSEQEEWIPIEERMANMMRNDPERRHRFEMSEACRKEMEKGNDVIGKIMNKNIDEYREKWNKFIDCVCEALKNGRESISVLELVQLMVNGV